LEVKLIYTEEAEKRIRDIFDYYSETASLKVAHSIVDQIIDETDHLIKNPYLGLKEELLENRTFNYYSLIINNYKVIYRIAENYIVIATVFDTRQNPKKIKKRVS
jgi:toxin ParE1/3/4